MDSTLSCHLLISFFLKKNLTKQKGHIHTISMNVYKAEVSHIKFSQCFANAALNLFQSEEKK